MENIGRFLMLGGIILFIVGGLVWLGARIGIPLGRLPGDIHLEGQNVSFHFPLASSIIVSIILTLLLNVIVRLMKK